MVIKTILDTDLYKFTTSYAYIKLFPYAMGTFSFKDRDETEYTLGFAAVAGVDAGIDGSNPDTSFDCSGFVSYVLTNSGLVNTGRLGAQGLYNVCTPVSKANAQPGDLIFFVGTYDTPGVSHVGIYVGDGVMIHCGDPIQYTSINSSYWQQHFYAFGRPAY